MLICGLLASTYVVWCIQRIIWYWNSGLRDGVCRRVNSSFCFHFFASPSEIVVFLLQGFIDPTVRYVSEP